MIRPSRPGEPSLTFCKQFRDRQPLAVFGDVERPAFHLECGPRRDSHRGQDRGVEIADRYWIARYQQRPFRSRLAVHVAAIEADHGLTQLTRSSLRQRVVRLLRNRLSLTDLVKRYPEIEAIQIEKPFIVVGMPRSGTTHLVNLIGADPRRDAAQVCVVEEPKDVQAVERTREFRGRYHVLGGALDPLSGVGPDQLRIRELLSRIGERVDDVDITEVIIATDPNTEGEATATYLLRMLRDIPGLTVTRIASGLPMGGDLEFADEMTLGRALIGRRAMV